MSYRLKPIRYMNRPTHILLQNENGPCPLLAAVNCLLLKNLIELTPLCKDHGFITLEDLTNLLADYAMQQHYSTDKTFHIEELMEHLPRFQYGMDVNPKFTTITAYEYTAELTAFDTLGATLVHGWLAEPESVYSSALGTASYNQVLDRVLAGQAAAVELSRLQSLADAEVEESQPSEINVNERIQEQQKLVEVGLLCQDFLQESSHQLTLAGIEALLKDLAENQPSVFFRNNHFGVILKHTGSLYLLVTDLGYGDTPDVVWERLDMVDGDTELCNADFIARKVVDVPAQSTEPMDADLQAALKLSMGDDAVGAMDIPQPPETPQEMADRMLALQLQEQTPAVPVPQYHLSDDARLAEDLQRQENSNLVNTRQQIPSTAISCCIM